MWARLRDYSPLRAVACARSASASRASAEVRVALARSSSSFTSASCSLRSRDKGSFQIRRRVAPRCSIRCPCHRGGRHCGLLGAHGSTPFMLPVPRESATWTCPRATTLPWLLAAGMPRVLSSHGPGSYGRGRLIEQRPGAGHDAVMLAVRRIIPAVDRLAASDRRRGDGRRYTGNDAKPSIPVHGAG